MSEETKYLIEKSVEEKCMKDVQEKIDKLYDFKSTLINTAAELDYMSMSEKETAVYRKAINSIADAIDYLSDIIRQAC